MAITATEARKKLFPLIERVNDEHEPMEILSRKGSAVLMSKEDFESWKETAYLFSSPANARALLESMQQPSEPHDLIEVE